MLRTLNVLVVDDEAPARELICRQIERSCPSLSVVKTASNVKQTKHYIDRLSPDVVFVDILHTEACSSYSSTVFLSSGRRITISKNLKRLEHILDDPLFFRVHNSQIVNLNRIHQCNYRLHLVTLDNGKEIPLAVRKREQRRHNMQQLMAS